jgi:hypothetical protein
MKYINPLSAAKYINLLSGGGVAPSLLTTRQDLLRTALTDPRDFAAQRFRRAVIVSSRDHVRC